MTASTERPFTLDHLDHVVLRVHDLETSVAFYQMLGGESGGPRPAGTAMRVTPNQTIILQEKPDQALTRYLTQTFFNFDLFWQVFRSSTATGIIDVSAPDRLPGRVGTLTNVVPR